MSDQLISLPQVPNIDERILLNLDSQYAEILNNFLVTLKTSTDIYELRKIFDDFSDKYLLLPELWIYRKNLYSIFVLTFVFANREEFDQINKKAYCSFYSPDFYTANGFTKYYYAMTPIINDQQMDLKNRSGIFRHYTRESPYIFVIPGISNNKIYNDLSFPHEKIEKVFKYYEANGDQFLPQNLYVESKKTIKSYEKLKTAKSVKEFFNAYIEIGNHTVAIQMIELLIDKYPTNRWLWLSYLKFLKARLPRVYLDVFQRYTKFFISDTEMLEFYKKERQRISCSINIFEHKSLEDLLLTQVSYNEYYFSEWRNPPFYPFLNAFDSFIKQNFSLPSPIIWYMLSHGTAQQVNALHHTCKHLFLQKQSPICCNFIIHHRFKTCDSPFYQQSFRIGPKLPSKMQKIFLAKSLTISCGRPKSILCSLISKISRCTIWSLRISGQNVSWNELYFLLESGNIEKFVFMNGRITVAENKLVAIENIVEVIPNAHTFITDSAAFTPKTFPRLAVLEKPTKFKEFLIKNLTHEFKFKDFNEFVNNHSEAKSKFTFWFDHLTRMSFMKNIQNLSKTMFKAWAPRKTRPCVSIRIVKKKKSNV